MEVPFDHLLDLLPAESDRWAMQQRLECRKLVQQGLDETGNCASLLAVATLGLQE